MIDVDHDLLKFCIYLFEGPAHTLAVLRHLKCRSSNSTCIGSFTADEQYSVVLQIFSCFQSSRHVSALAYCSTAVCNELFCIFQKQLVLSCTRKSDIAFDLPYSASLMILSARSCSRILSQTCTFNLFYFFQKRKINSLRIIYPTGRIRYCNNFCTHLLSFLSRIDCYVSGTGYTADFIFHIHTMTFHQLTGDIEKSITGCLCTSQRSSEGQSFSCQNAFVTSGNSLILSVHVADLSCAGSNISSRYIHISSDVFI